MRSTIDISAEALAEVLPILRSAVTIVGSAQSPSDHIVRLVVEGDALPDAAHVLSAVTKTVSGNQVSLTIEFMSDDAQVRTPTLRAV